ASKSQNLAIRGASGYARIARRGGAPLPRGIEIAKFSDLDASRYDKNARRGITPLPPGLSIAKFGDRRASGLGKPGKSAFAQAPMLPRSPRSAFGDAPGYRRAQSSAPLRAARQALDARGASVALLASRIAASERVDVD